MPAQAQALQRFLAHLHDLHICVIASTSMSCGQSHVYHHACKIHEDVMAPWCQALDGPSSLQAAVEGNALYLQRVCRWASIDHWITYPSHGMLQNDARDLQQRSASMVAGRCPAAV